jgi:hypothetical protein
MHFLYISHNVLQTRLLFRNIELPPNSRSEKPPEPDNLDAGQKAKMEHRPRTAPEKDPHQKKRSQERQPQTRHAVREDVKPIRTPEKIGKDKKETIIKKDPHLGAVEEHLKPSASERKKPDDIAFQNLQEERKEIFIKPESIEELSEGNEEEPMGL